MDRIDEEATKAATEKGCDLGILDGSAMSSDEQHAGQHAEAPMGVDLKLTPPPVPEVVPGVVTSVSFGGRRIFLESTGKVLQDRAAASDFYDLFVGLAEIRTEEL